MQKQIYLHFAEAKYLRRSQNTKKPGQTQPESDFIQAKSKIVKGERKRELVPCFPRRILSKTMSKIGKEERNRAGLHAQIAEPHPIFCKDHKNLRNNGRIRVKFDKWLVHIPFLCYLTILLISAEGAVYGGY